MGKIHTYSDDEIGNLSLGQIGSILAKQDAITAKDGHVIVAIQFLSDSVFESGATGLIAETEQLYLDDTGTSTSISTSGGNAIDGVTFPKGITIFGRWTGFELNSGTAIAYVG